MPAPRLALLTRRFVLFRSAVVFHRDPLPNPSRVGKVRLSDLPKHSGGMLAVSQSGETKDVQRAVRVAQQVGRFVFVVLAA